MLGKLEELVMLATIRSGPNALPSAVYERLVCSAAPGEKTVAFGAVYTTLDRLAKKGLIDEGSTRDDRGRERRTFAVSASGQNALTASVSRLAALGGFRLAGAKA